MKNRLLLLISKKLLAPAARQTKEPSENIETVSRAHSTISFSKCQVYASNWRCRGFGYSFLSIREPINLTIREKPTTTAHIQKRTGKARNIKRTANIGANINNYLTIVKDSFYAI